MAICLENVASGLKNSPDELDLQNHVYFLRKIIKSIFDRFDRMLDVPSISKKSSLFLAFLPSSMPTY
jgi:hypothetical protein